MPSIFAYPRQLFKPFAKGGPLAMTPSEGPMRQRLGKGRQSLDLETLTKRIILPSLPVADEDLARLQHWDTGRRLARQGHWEKLSQMITLADDARLTTPGGSGEATLLAMGAQSDVTAAATDALSDATAPDPAGLQDLQSTLDEFPDQPALALVVALAHVNIGRAWVSALPNAPQLTSCHREHFKRAQSLLNPFDAEELDSPSLAAAQCMIAEIMCPDAPCIAAAYRRLLRLDPHNSNHLRAFGKSMVHDMSDDPSVLEQQAQAFDQSTQTIWGDGAYMWLYFDVLGQCDEALAILDAPRFIRGLESVLRAKPDQHVVNELAAFCAIAMAPRPESEPRDAALTRATLHSMLDRILSDHLAELHPMVWSEQPSTCETAPRNTVPRALAAQGRKTALRVIASRFADQLADGSTIAFSPAGMYRLPAM